MDTQKVPRIEVSEDSAHIKNLGLADSTVVDYLQQFDSSQERKDVFV